MGIPRVDANLDHDVNQFWSLLFSIIMDAEKRLGAYLAAHNLTPPQFYVLKTLVEHGGSCLIGEIARAHHLTNATMTGLVKRLEASNPPLVVREQNAADRRSVHVILTPAGQERYWAVQADLVEQLRVIVSLLSPEERQTVLGYLARYVQIINELFPAPPAEESP